MTEAVLTRAVRLQAAALSDAGRVRQGNEDRAFVDVDRGIFLVVDGVGGHAAGEVAASIAVDVITQRLERPVGSAAQRVREAIALANNEILRQAERSPAHAGMTCVLTLALVTDDRVTIGHVGDSRLYKLTPEGLRKLTHDHSPVGEREDAGELTEADAMKHPRRNEVFRDVGSAFREPDDPDFVELIETTLQPNEALLLCSDGLSDLVPSAEIAVVVQRHAGDPARVVTALIDAANAAGGKDNVTAVFVEGEQFASTMRKIAAPGAQARSTSRRNLAWLGVALLLGFVAGFAASEWLPMPSFWGLGRSRTLIVGTGAAGGYPTIEAAMASASAGDVVQIEPGEYAESVTVKDGVHLIARVPGTVTLLAPSGYLGWTSIAVNGRLESRIAGLRVLGRPDAPVSVGVVVTGENVLIDGVAIQGVVLRGADIATTGSVTLRASQFVDVQGLPLRIGAAAQPLVQQNIFVRTSARDASPAIEVAGTGAPRVIDNVFSGYQNAVQWPAGTAQVSRENFVMRGAPHGR